MSLVRGRGVLANLNLKILGILFFERKYLAWVQSSNSLIEFFWTNASKLAAVKKNGWKSLGSNHTAALLIVGVNRWFELELVQGSFFNGNGLLN